MKRKGLLFIFSALAAVLLLGVITSGFLGQAKTKQENELPKLPADSVQIIGEVQAVEANRILINSPTGGLLYITVSNATEIYKNGKSSSLTDIKAENRLQIDHNGIVLKSHPGQIHTAYRITVLEAE